VSLIFHAPQSAGELLDVSLGVVKRHAGLLGRIALWPVVGIAVVDLATQALPEAASLVTMWFLFAIYGWGEAAVSLAAWRLLHQEPVDPASVWATVGGSLGSVAIGYSLKWAGLLLGLIFFVVPMAFLLTRWFAVPSANVIERLGIRAGFRRSRELARGNRWQIFITIALLDLGLVVASVGLGYFFVDDVTGRPPLWFTVGGWIWSLLYLVFHATLSAALYANARMRSEGYDVESLLA
jgi:hypothetical protein